MDFTVFWQETEAHQRSAETRDDVVDISFRIQCTQLPVDHAYALCTAIHRFLPWLPEQSGAGIHLIHGAESGNGWNRPDDSGRLVLSRRTRLTLRVPVNRCIDTMALSGAVLCVDGCRIDVGEATVKPLVASTTVFCRHVRTAPHWSESEFLQNIARQLLAMDIEVRKMLSGKLHQMQAIEGFMHTRSIMIAELDLNQSIRLQKCGLGEWQAFGIGLILPHKGIEAVFNKSDEH